MIQEIWFGIAMILMWGTTLVLYFDNRKRISAHDRELTVLAVAYGQLADDEGEDNE